MFPPVERSMHIIDAALCANSITRTEYNCVRRCATLLDDEQVKMWLILADAIWDHRLPIVEDGSPVFEGSDA